MYNHIHPQLSRWIHSLKKKKPKYQDSNFQSTIEKWKLREETNFKSY